MDEVWKPIVGYEGRYLVSNMGNVKSLWRKRGGRNGVVVVNREILIKLFDNGKGYLVVSLGEKVNRKNYYVHRLVATAFCDNPKNYTVVNHIDGNPSNNRSDNLEWCTTDYNVKCAAPQMHKPKSVVRSSTGEKYICKRITKNGKERYCLYIREKGISKNFVTLSDAVKYRNEVMKE